MNSQRINEAGDKVITSTMEAVKSHPVITALVGFGVSWFMANNLFKKKTDSGEIVARLQDQIAQLQEKIEQSTPALKESAQEAGNILSQKSQSVMAGVSGFMDEKLPALKETAKETGGIIIRKSQSALDGVSGYVEENPLMTGFIGLSAGLVLGLLTSGIFKESSLFEETKQIVQKKTRQIMQETKEKAGHVMDVAGKTAREQAERRNLISH